MPDVRLMLGDCLDAMKGMPDNSVDAIVTDPPYGLSFMGRKWDYDVPSVDIWRECLRVLKPGGHLLAFAGTRTQHRMAVNIEDAGFEIRDMIAWVYGSGFPKSMDVSKAIDKRGGTVAGFFAFRDAVKDAMRRNGISRVQLQEALGNFMLSHYLTAGSQPAIPNSRDYRIIRDTVGLGNRFDELFSEEAERETVGQETKARSTNGKSALPTVGGETVYETWNITAPATEAARQWDGWGTALKPALEPITVARKPLIGTVAANVLEHGTGGLNIDACRVDASWESDINFRANGRTNNITTGQVFNENVAGFKQSRTYQTQGRWPANLIHDGSEEVTALFPVTTSGARNGVKKERISFGPNGTFAERARDTGHQSEASTGSAARFFYCAKASKHDRDEGLEGMEERGGHLASPEGGGGGWSKDSAKNPNLPRANHHPTVKPVSLMKYLVRLITPPGGVVLDPFCGSGSTLKAAILEGFDCIGIELDAEYLAIAQARCDHAKARLQMPLLEAE